MKRSALIAAFVLATAGTAFASSHAGNGKEVQRSQVSLTVKGVDQKNDTLTFQAPISPNAVADENGKPIGLKQLKEGDQIRAAFDPSTGSVTHIEVIRSQDQSQDNQK